MREKIRGGAGLFPCGVGVFDVVIIDEAYQVDLPSITPILYRGKLKPALRRVRRKQGRSATGQGLQSARPAVRPARDPFAAYR